MKAYLIDPPFEVFGNECERTSAAVDLIADIVFKSLRGGGDIFQYALGRVDKRDSQAG